LWGKPPDLDLEAEADLHTLLRGLADRKLIHSARDVSDGGIAIALAQAGFSKGIGAAVEQEQSLLAHPLFGLFAEPASTVFVTATEGHVGAIQKLATEYNFFSARIGTTGGDRLEIAVDHQPLISAPLAELREPWATALEATLHDEVAA
jgi:phosphoribosylformylglycinamidine synthase